MKHSLLKLFPGAAEVRFPGLYFLLTPFGRENVDPDDLRRIDSCFEHGMLLKDSRSTTAALAAVSSSGNPVFLKRCNNKGLSFTLRYLFRRARVFRAAFAASLLESLGIRTPRVLFAGERRSGLILKAGYLATTTSPEIHSVHYLFRETGAPESLLDSFLPYAARTAALLHRNRIEHGDFKVINFYHTGRWTSDSTYGIWDLDSMRRHRGRIPAARVSRELAWLVFSIHLVASKNPLFPKELCSPESLSERLVSLYRSFAEKGEFIPETAAVLKAARGRIEYRRKHPYATPKVEPL